MRFQDRVIGCFKGLATGDAIGKQTETLARDDVLRWYPRGIAGFEGRPGDVIPRYAGKRYEWRIGETTDDTEQTLAVTRALLNEPAVNHQAIGRELLKCRKSTHPGVSLWAFLEIGDPARIATEGDGCGAAMRSAPIGVICPTSDLANLVRAARECALPTHGGPLAIAAAAAVAAAVSAALEGRAPAEVLAVAIEASGGMLPIERIYSDLRARTPLSPDDVAARHFPGNAPTIAGLAIALALITASAEYTALLAANIGGDADSVASIGGAIAGAMHPETVNPAWFEIVAAVNRDPILELAVSLAALRQRD